MTTFKKGDIVLYSPSMMPGQPKFGGAVRDDTLACNQTLKGSQLTASNILEILRGEA